MSKCFGFSFTSSLNWYYRSCFTRYGLRSTMTDLGDGTVMHCWVPKSPDQTKSNLVLIHGFGPHATWQWSDFGRRLIPYFNIYVPDLLFHGDSYTTQPDRSESFQAQCIMQVMEINSVKNMSLVGLSYGGFVAYSMAAKYEEAVERVVICCAGLSLEEKDLEAGLFPASDLDEAVDILMPSTPEQIRILTSYALLKPPSFLPDWYCNDYINVMYKDYVEEKKELIRALVKGRKLSELPVIRHPTLIMWGEKDRIFPLELGHRLKRHLGEKANLEIIMESGHAFIGEKPNETFEHMKSFLLHSVPSSTATTTLHINHRKPHVI